MFAAAATQEDAKDVVVSARDFCTDEMAFSMQAVLSAQGISLRSRNPGNLTLFVNALHWLNDNESIMNLGQPLDVATLEIAEGPTLSFLKFLVWGLWPLAAALCGVAAWYVRRR